MGSRGPGPRAPGARTLVPWAILAVLFVAWEVQRWGGFYAASDDSYIYLGYVKRVLTSPHQLFSYNAGEHSAGTTGVVYYYLLIVVCGATRLLTLPLPVEHSLLIGMVVLDAALFIATAAVYLRIWTLLAGRVPRGTVLAGLFTLFCLQPQFLWGMFSGLENPLSALLVLVLVEQMVRRRPAWQVGMASALLCGTRPELAPLAVWLPALAAWRAPARTRALWIEIAAAFVVWALTLAVVLAPCLALTGRVFPSALGARVTIDVLADPTRWGTLDFWSTSWVAGAAVGLVVTAGSSRRGDRLVPALFAVLLAFYVMRAVLGLTDFNLEARYVSYLWPLYALGIAWSVRQVGARLDLAVEATPGRRRLAMAAAFLASLPSLFEFRARFDQHVHAMNHLVVAPSRWMQRNLPAGSRIAMEPAGAIRVFTDHYLVDAVGLTTTHFATFRGSFPSFWVAHHVDYVFDYTGRVADLGRGVLGEPLRTWGDPAALGLPLEGWGTLATYRMDLPSVELTAVATSASEPGNSEPLAAFDNWLGSVVPRVPYWFAGNVGPAWIEARFARPVAVGAIELTTWGRKHSLQPAGRHTPGSFTFHGWDGTDWVPLTPAAVRSHVPAASLETLSIELPAPAVVSGLRFHCERTVGGERFAPVVLEISLLDGARRYVWRGPVARRSAGAM